MPHDASSKKSVIEKLECTKEQEKFIIILNPGGNIKVQHWPDERFAEVGNWLLDRYECKLAITGTISEFNIAERIVLATQGRAINITGTTLKKLIELVRMAKMCISNDTGTMHVAAALGIPTIGIFGTRIPVNWWFPLAMNNNLAIIFSPPLCAWCYRDDCEDVLCLKNITVNHVLETIKCILTLSRINSDK